MSDELTTTATPSSVPLPLPTSNPDTIIPQLAVPASEPVAGNHLDAAVKEVSETEAEKPRPTPPRRSRLKAVGRYAAERVGSACDRALILLIALGLLALLKGCAGMVGVPIP